MNNKNNKIIITLFYILNSKPLFKHFTMQMNDEIWRFDISRDVQRDVETSNLIVHFYFI